MFRQTIHEPPQLIRIHQVQLAALAPDHGHPRNPRGLEHVRVEQRDAREAEVGVDLVEPLKVGRLEVVQGFEGARLEIDAEADHGLLQGADDLVARRGLVRAVGAWGAKAVPV